MDFFKTKRKKKVEEIMANKHRFELWNVNFSKPIRHPYLCHDGYLYKHMGKKTNKAGNHVVYYYCITGKGFDEKYWGDRAKPICKASVGIERDGYDGIVSIMVKHCHKHMSSCHLFPKDAINWIKPWNLYTDPTTNQVKGFEELWNPDHKRPQLCDTVYFFYFFLSKSRQKRKGWTMDSESDEEAIENGSDVGTEEKRNGVNNWMNSAGMIGPMGGVPFPFVGQFRPPEVNEHSTDLGYLSNLLKYGALPPHHPMAGLVLHTVSGTNDFFTKDDHPYMTPRKKRRLDNDIMAIDSLASTQEDGHDDTTTATSPPIVSTSTALTTSVNALASSSSSSSSSLASSSNQEEDLLHIGSKLAAPPLLHLSIHDLYPETSPLHSPFGPTPIIPFPPPSFFFFFF
ncbi:hypothetical protein RFI_24944 [Reticulomyxa filosa]|uniref:Uncharacterized protein n=1 Tax=Reticulomyxa filosa TaxID=46433 RepID=X6MHA6_RETFI|nr:hypothetical protein RFI_24944 [Reticulomyxa filosa]|eukprot:ETO12430.1 hypothetical protein RFI_24944 [Reticulomyxa filosa]